MEPKLNGGQHRETEHITAVVFRWVVFVGMSVLFLAGVALAVTALWRWIF
jgi:hypothetical protein